MRRMGRMHGQRQRQLQLHFGSPPRESLVPHPQSRLLVHPLHPRHPLGPSVLDACVSAEGTPTTGRERRSCERRPALAYWIRVPSGVRVGPPAPSMSRLASEVQCRDDSR